jgi:prepilin-type N-terminal cleavage/methylation domain-containing protein
MKIRRGFTLIELLVVIAIIAVLVALLLPVLSNAKRKAAQVACINNQKQLAIGIKMYLEDNNDTFPGIASRMYGYHSQDWIYWRTNTANYPSFAKSPIVAAAPGLQQLSVRCPLDNNDNDRIHNFEYPDNDGPYLFSYSITGYGLDDNGNNAGLATVVDSSSGTLAVYAFKENSVKNPSAKIMLAEEPGTLASWDSPDQKSLIQDGRWVPNSDPLTIRHGGRADVAFNDDHVQAVTPDFGWDIDNSMPDQ